MKKLRTANLQFKGFLRRKKFSLSYILFFSREKNEAYWWPEKYIRTQSNVVCMFFIGWKLRISEERIRQDLTKGHFGDCRAELAILRAIGEWLPGTEAAHSE